MPSQKLLIKVNTDGTAEAILTDEDFDAWAKRAEKARNDKPRR